MTPQTATLQDRVVDTAIRAVLRVALAIPYRWRVPLVGWVVAHLAAPLAGWNRHTDENPKYVLPELGPYDRKAIMRAVADNAGRTLIEIYSGAEFADRVKDTPLTGPGAETLREARAEGRPVILVTAHFGNYDAPRAALFAQGLELAAIYRPMKNALFNDHYVKAISEIGAPAYPSGRAGLVKFMRHVAGGGMIGVLFDLYTIDGAPLTFFGATAPSPLSAAQWALKYDALLIPIYGIRQPDGLSFEIRVEAPIPHSTPEEMTQALNDGLEALVRTHVDQWFWIHRRWRKSLKAPAPRRG